MDGYACGASAPHGRPVKMLKKSCLINETAFCMDNNYLMM